MTERAAPFYCPYCGETDIRPFGESHTEWNCRSCRRVFRVSYQGLAGDGTATSDRPAEPKEDS
jgi:transposase-like protein